MEVKGKAVARGTDGGPGIVEAHDIGERKAGTSKGLLKIEQLQVDSFGMKVGWKGPQFIEFGGKSSYVQDKVVN